MADRVVYIGGTAHILKDNGTLTTLGGAVVARPGAVSGTYVGATGETTHTTNPGGTITKK